MYHPVENMLNNMSFDMKKLISVMIMDITKDLYKVKMAKLS